MEKLLIINAALTGILLAIIIFKIRSDNNAKLLQVMQENFILMARHLEILEQRMERSRQIMQNEWNGLHNDNSNYARNMRDEMSISLQRLQDALLTRIIELNDAQDKHLAGVISRINELTISNENRIERMRHTIEERLQFLQIDNSKKLDEMRLLVDEKLHATLEQRLGESFKLVSEQLETVHQGLGEMKSLAVGVGDLKKVLSNVKNRGIWGEIQLGNILEDFLAPEQYACNVATHRGSNERVEYAIKMPGRGRNEEVVWLPIDAKFPQEDYLRLWEAQEKGDTQLAEEVGKQLENTIKREAKNIKDKYLDPPHTTDFAVMFLPTEGLYAEVVKRDGLINCLQKDFRVNVAGPSTMAALINSLALGFRTLAIEKHSSEIWRILGEVKTEFNRFGIMLDKTRKKLTEASNTIDTAARKSRTIERKLRGVQEIPIHESAEVLDAKK